MIATLFVTFILLLACSFPIAVSQSFASMFLIFGDAPLSLESFTKAIMSGFSSFTLVAIPLFTFAGDIMGKGGISKRLINVAKLSLGNRTGGLGIVSIVACMIFAAISGTGSATVAAIGLIMIPEMLEAGYDRAYSASLVAPAGRYVHGDQRCYHYPDPHPAAHRNRARHQPDSLRYDYDSEPCDRLHHPAARRKPLHGKRNFAC